MTEQELLIRGLATLEQINDCLQEQDRDVSLSQIMLRRQILSIRNYAGYLHSRSPGTLSLHPDLLPAISTDAGAR